MTATRIPSLKSVIDALTRHTELRLSDNSLSLQLDGEHPTYTTRRGPVQSSNINYRYTVTLSLHPSQMKTLIKILNAAPVNGEPAND